MVPRIETRRLVLRGFARSDLDAYKRGIFGDPEVAKQFPDSPLSPHERTRMAFVRNQELWRTHGYGLWAVVDKGQNAFVGHCGFLNLESSREVEIGYAIVRSRWHQGLASEAAAASLQYGFERLRLERIVAITRPENAASQNVLKKIGLRFERDTFYYKLKVKYYALDRAEYKPVRQ